jgi:hypothetical protein
VTASEIVTSLPVAKATECSGKPAKPDHPSFLVELSAKSACVSAVEQPVTAGIPFPKGQLADSTHLRLLGPDGGDIPLQLRPLAHWSDGSVKWLLLDFILPPIPQGRNRFELTPGLSGTKSNGVGGISVEETLHSLVVATGTATFHLSRNNLPMDRVVVGSREVLEKGCSEILLTDAKGGRGKLHVELVSVEARGPVRATVKYDGTFAGRVPCRFVARLCFFAHTSLVRMRFTIHNPNRARHKGGLWDLGDAGSLLFRDLSFHIRLKGPGDPSVAWTAEPGQPVQSAPGGNLEIFQASSGGDNWQSKNHVNRLGQVPCPFRGYRLRRQGKEEFGLRANPVVSIQGSSGTVTGAVPEFWQQFPKALEVEAGELRVGLFPRQWGDLFELQGGEQKTHTVWLHFGPPASGDPVPFPWVHQPAQLFASAKWYSSTGVLPCVVDASMEFGGNLAAYVREILDGNKNLFARREIIDEYGWRHFGEVYADHENAYYTGPKPVVSHFNNQYDLIYGAILQCLSTDETRWQVLYDPLARHVIDIDIYHTSKDRPAYNGGLFWLTDHYRDAATCTHRTYSRSNCPANAPSGYGGGPSNEHNYTTGLLHYYFLTGDPQAQAAVLGLADWVIAMDANNENLLGLIDDGPTGLASKTRDGYYHGPGRGCANSINALLDAWLASGTRCYLDKAEELIRRSVHPADNIAARELLDVEKRWSYTVFFAVLARFLDLKAEAGELDRMYAYGRASLLHYAGWMLDHEEPYFDHPEKLEFPTETWAAQELRKANVLRLAAAHAAEPLRNRLLRRGAELAKRAWDDLLAFESRHVTRAVALVLVEGLRDSYFRHQPVCDRPRGSVGCDFGKPQDFVAQKQRVLAKLKTLRGLLEAVMCLARPRVWRTLGSRALGR